MPAPTDFLSPFLQVQQPTPVQAFAQGQQIGTGLLNAQVLGEERARARVEDQRAGVLWDQAQADRARMLAEKEQARLAAEQAAQAKAQADAQIAALQQKFAETRDPNIAMAIAALRPDLAEPMKKTFEMATAAQKQDYADAMTTVYNLLDNGAVDLAKGELDARRLAFEEAGDKRQADAMANMIKRIDQNPVATQGMVAMWIGQNAPQAFEGRLKGATLGADVEKAKADAARAQQEAQIKAIEARFEERKQKASLAQIYANIKRDAKRLELDEKELALKTLEREDKIREKETGPLPENINREVTDLVIKSTTAGETAGQMEQLANKLASFRAKALPGEVQAQTGLTGRVVGAAGRFVGAESDLAELRRQYVGIQNKSIAAANSGQGSMSDADRRALGADFIANPDAATPEALAADIARRAAILRRSEDRASAAAEFKVINRGNQRSAQDIVLSDGTTVPAGTSMATFGTAHATAKAERRAEELAAQGMKPQEIEAQLASEGLGDG
jgi:hypothetical protein